MMINQRSIYSLLAALALVLFAYGCVEDEDPIIDNPEEVITTVTWTLFPDNTAAETVVFGFSDADGDGGNDPVMTMTGTLQANAIYRGQVAFGNDGGSIDGEIVEEGVDHQVFYPTSSSLNLTVNYDDMDRNGNPIGLNTQVLTGDASTGSFQIILRHEPDKTIMALPENPAAAGGETDVEVSFTASIQ